MPQSFLGIMLCKFHKNIDGDVDFLADRRGSQPKTAPAEYRSPISYARSPASAKLIWFVIRVWRCKIPSVAWPSRIDRSQGLLLLAQSRPMYHLIFNRTTNRMWCKHPTVHEPAIPVNIAMTKIWCYPSTKFNEDPRVIHILGTSS